jgi:hypothetical protein
LGQLALEEQRVVFAIFDEQHPQSRSRFVLTDHLIRSDMVRMFILKLFA